MVEHRSPGHAGRVRDHSEKSRNLWVRKLINQMSNRLVEVKKASRFTDRGYQLTLPGKTGFEYEYEKYWDQQIRPFTAHVMAKWIDL